MEARAEGGEGAPGSGTRQARGWEDRGRLVGWEAGSQQPLRCRTGASAGCSGSGGAGMQACPPGRVPGPPSPLWPVDGAWLAGPGGWLLAGAPGLTLSCPYVFGLLCLSSPPCSIRQDGLPA